MGFTKDNLSRFNYRNQVQYIIFFLFSFSLHAGRPLITDDAEVVGDNKIQLETWGFLDERSFQHWIVPTIGINDIEFNVSTVQGTILKGDEARQYSISGPIIQTKYMISETSSWDHPGFGISGGLIAPYGKGAFKSQSWDYFFYGALSGEIIPELVIVHLNLGQQTRRQLDNSKPIFLWGVAFEHRTWAKTHTFVETSNGDIFALNPGIAAHSGFRHDLTATFQVDGTLGTGLTGDPKLPYWVTFGIKILTDM